MRHVAFAPRIMTAAAVLAFAAAAFAAPREAPSKNVVGSPGDAGSSVFFFGTGFEPGEGFAPIALEPQNGWTGTGVNLPFASVSTVNPFTGVQHLRLVRNAGAAAGSSHLVLSPLNPSPPNTPSTAYVKVAISNDGGADYTIAAQAPSQTFISWRVVFSWSGDAAGDPGHIYILDDPGTGLAFINTGVVWTEGVYKELRVDFNPVAGTIEYYYDGAHIYTGIVYAGTAIEQFVALHDNFQLTGETCDIDALSIQGFGEPPVAVESKTWSQVKSLMR